MFYSRGSKFSLSLYKIEDRLVKAVELSICIWSKQCQVVPLIKKLFLNDILCKSQKYRFKSTICKVHVQQCALVCQGTAIVFPLKIKFQMIPQLSRLWGRLTGDSSLLLQLTGIQLSFNFIVRCSLLLHHPQH